MISASVYSIGAAIYVFSDFDITILSLSNLYRVFEEVQNIQALIFFKQLIYVVALAFFRVIAFKKKKKKSEVREEGFEPVVALVIFFSRSLINLH